MSDVPKTYIPIADEFTMALFAKLMPQLQFIEVKAMEVEQEEELVLVTSKKNNLDG